jgi:hypothetical protein
MKIVDQTGNGTRWESRLRRAAGPFSCNIFSFFVLHSSFVGAAIMKNEERRMKNADLVTAR